MCMAQYTLKSAKRSSILTMPVIGNQVLSRPRHCNAVSSVNLYTQLKTATTNIKTNANLSIHVFHSLRFFSYRTQRLARGPRLRLVFLAPRSRGPGLLISGQRQRQICGHFDGIQSQLQFLWRHVELRIRVVPGWRAREAWARITAFADTCRVGGWSIPYFKTAMRDPRIAFMDWKTKWW